MRKKTAAVIAGAGTVACTAAMLPIISKMNIKTGVLPRDNALLCYLLYFGIMLVCAVLTAIFGGKNDKSDASESPVSGSWTIAMGFGLLLLAICSAQEGIAEIGTVIPLKFLTALDFVGTVLFAVMAFATLSKKTIPAWLGFMYSFGGAYFVVRGMCCFVSRMAVVTFPEYLIECLGTLICGMFFAFAAKVFTGNGGRFTRAAFCFLGTAIAELTISSCLGTLAAKLFLPEEISGRIVFTAGEAEAMFQNLHGIDAYYMSLPTFVHTAAGIFAAVCVAALLFGRGEER